MKIISCEACGVMIDTDRLPEVDMEDEEGCIDSNKALWINRNYVPSIFCPVCKSQISLEKGDLP